MNRAMKQGVRRTTGMVQAEVGWYGTEGWCDLPVPVCNQIRDLLDAACDLANGAVAAVRARRETQP